MQKNNPYPRRNNLILIRYNLYLQINNLHPMKNNLLLMI